MVHLNPHNLTMAIGQRFVRILARRSELVSAHHLGSAGDDRGHVPITQLGEGTHLHLHLRPRGGGGDTVVSPAIPPEDATSPRDDNREVGGQTIVYLRASPRSSASHYIVARVHQLFRHRHQSWPKVSMSCPA